MRCQRQAEKECYHQHYHLVVLTRVEQTLRAPADRYLLSPVPPLVAPTFRTHANTSIYVA